MANQYMYGLYGSEAFSQKSPRAGVRVSNTFGKTMKCVHPYINRYITLFCTHVLIIRNMLQCTHCAHYPQTCSASHARLALQHVGDFDVRLSARMIDHVLGRSGAADSYRCVGLHVDSAMPCCYLVAWRDADRGPACRWIPAWIPANHRRLAAYHV